MLFKYYSKNNLPDNVKEKKKKVLQSIEKLTHLTLQNSGIDPDTSSMLSGRSTIWANSPECVQHLKLVTPVAVTEKIWKALDFFNLNRKYWLQRIYEFWPSSDRVSCVRDLGYAHHWAYNNLVNKKYTNLINLLFT